MWTRAELKDNAKKFFKFNYWKMVLVALVLAMVSGGGSSAGSRSASNAIGESSYGYMSPAEAAGFMVGFLTVMLIVMVIGLALSVFLLNPLVVGAQRFFVVSHYQKAELGELGYGFSNSYMNVVKTMFLRALYVFLWSLLFVIPGIIKGYEYRMIPYILAENPGIDSKDAFAMSKQMMDGNKWNAFVLDLSFLGWIILSMFTCGILAIFYVNPYVYMTNAELYVALKEITFGGGASGWQNGAGYQQSYQPNQGYQNSQNYQQNQGWQNGQGYQQNQGWQNGQGYQQDQGWQNGQGYQQDQGWQNDQSYQNNTGYQDMNQVNDGQTGNHQDGNFQM